MGDELLNFINEANSMLSIMTMHDLCSQKEKLSQEKALEDEKDGKGLNHELFNLLFAVES